MYNQQITYQFKEIKNHPSITKTLSINESKKKVIQNEEKDIKISKVKKITKNSKDNIILQKKRQRGNKKNNNINEVFKSPLQLTSNTQSIINLILNKKVGNKNVNQNINENKSSLELSKKTIEIINKTKENLNKIPCKSNSTGKVNISLSKKTLDCINEIRKERLNKFDRKSFSNEIKRSESSFSTLRFKYEDLIKEKRELPLPTKYKFLLNSFENLELTINNFKSIKSSKTINLNRICESIESSLKRRFNLDIFKQILYVGPFLYILKWVKNSEKNDYDLLVDIPKNYDQNIKKYSNKEKDNLTDFNFNEFQNNFIPEYNPTPNNILEERKSFFKNALLKLVYEEHKKFLEKINFSNFDPYKTKTWHHEFDLEKVKDIPMFNIEEKPTNHNPYENTIIKNDIRSYLVDKCINYEENKVKKEEKNSILSKYCSPEFLNKLRKKEEAIKISNEILNYTSLNHSQQDIIKNISNLIIEIKTLTIISKKESWNFSELIKKLLISKNINVYFNEKELYNTIQKLIIIFPNWIKLINHSIFGKTIVIEGNVDVRKEIIPNLKKEDFS